MSECLPEMYFDVENAIRDGKINRSFGLKYTQEIGSAMNSGDTAGLLGFMETLTKRLRETPGPQPPRKVRTLAAVTL